MLAAELSYQQYDQGSLNNVPGVFSNYQDRPSSFCLLRPRSWKFWTLQFQKLEHPILLNLVQQNRLSRCASAKNRTGQFSKLEHPIFLKKQIFLDLIKNLMLVVPNHLPIYFHP
jgi:hypothetical protein